MSTTRNATTTPQVPRGVDPAAHWRRQVVPSCPFAGTSDRHTHLGCKAESSRRNNLRGNRIGDWLHQPPSGKGVRRSAARQHLLGVEFLFVRLDTAEVNVIAPYVHLSAPSHARIMLVGEQPGDQEDLAGRRSRRQTARRGARSRARAWRAPPSTSPTPSSTSNANRAANAGPARSGSLLPLA